MPAPRSDRRLQALATLSAAAPFAFALIRAVRTGNDLRYLWVAVGSFAGAAAVMAIGKASARRPLAILARSAVAFVTATLLAVVVAALVGTAVQPGLLVVAVAFGACATAGELFFTLAKP